MRYPVEVKLPSTTASESVGIVVLNPVGSSISQDTGRDSQDLANHFGLLTIAADRPTSYQLPRDRKLIRNLTDNAVRVMSPLASKINHTAESYGIDRLVLIARSAGALGILELACTEKLPATHLYAAEPVGCYNLPVRLGPAHFREYNRVQKHLLNVDTENRFIRPVADWKDLPLKAKVNRFAAMPFLLNTDTYYNADRWCRPTTIQLAGQIALNLPSLDTTLEFAEYSLAAPDDSIINEQLIPLANQHPHFSVTRVANTTHNSFDNRAFLAGRVAPIIERALEAS